MESDGDNYTSNNNQMYMNKEYPKNLDNKKILKPIRQEKIVKVNVTEYVEKIIEQEEIKYVNKYVDVIKPIITYKTKHVPKPIYLDKIRYETKVIEKEKIVHIPKIQYKNKIVDVPVYVHREKIIEKKVPLIIERIVPILKVKKSQKDVYIDSVALPEICESKNKDKIDVSNKKINGSSNNLLKRRDNSSRKQSVQRNNSITHSVRINEDDTANMKTYRLNEDIANSEINSNIQQELIKENTNMKNTNKNSDNRSNESSQAYSEADYNQNDFNNVQKHETKYHDDILRESSNSGNNNNNNNNNNNIDTAYSENQNIIYSNDNENENEDMNEDVNEERKNEPNYLGNGSSYLVKTNNQYNTLGVSIHLPDYENSSNNNYSDIHNINMNNNKSVNNDDPNYNLSINNIQYSNNILNNNNDNLYNSNNISSKRFLSNNINHYNKSASEQVFKNDNNSYVDPKIHYSYPNQEIYQDNYQTYNFNKEQNHMEFNPKYSQMHINQNADNITMQNIDISEYNNQMNQNQNQNQNQSQNFNASKQSIRPSYANSNGQAMVSVRPATIVEYKPKPRKLKNPMCNFLNNCCGGK